VSRLNYILLSSVLAIFSFKAISFLVVILQSVYHNNEILFYLVVLCVVFVGLWLFVMVKAAHEDRVERLERQNPMYHLAEKPLERITHGRG
jgi:uncharacterized membrane protein